MRDLASLLALALCACSGGDGRGADAGDDFSAGTASFAIRSHEIRGEVLRLDVEYSGGCEEHSFRFCWGGFLAPSDPPQVPIEAHHYDNGDSCEALISESIFVDFSRLVPLGDEVNVGIQIRVGDETVSGYVLDFSANQESFDLAGDELLPLEEACATIRS